MALKDHILKLADGVSKCQENAKSLAQVIFRGLDDIADNLPEHPGGGSDVSVTQVLSSGTKTATITVDDVDTDLYAPDPTDVGVTQVLSSGTKIATVTVDDVPTDLYAPTPNEPTDVDVTQVVSTGTKIATISVDNVPTDIYAPSISQDYSTIEHVVGKWIDGITNVYEKVITFTNRESTFNDYVTIESITNLDTLIELNGSCKRDLGVNGLYQMSINSRIELDANYYIGVRLYNNELQYKIGGYGSAITDIIIIMRYTKTS